MQRSGGKAGRPFGDYKVDQLEQVVKNATAMDDLHAVRAELQFRSTKRAADLKDLVDRLIRVKTESYDPKAR